MLIGLSQLNGAFVNQAFVGGGDDPAEPAVIFTLVPFIEAANKSVPSGGVMTPPYEKHT